MIINNYITISLIIILICIVGQIISFNIKRNKIELKKMSIEENVDSIGIMNRDDIIDKIIWSSVVLVVFSAVTAGCIFALTFINIETDNSTEIELIAINDYTSDNINIDSYIVLGAGGLNINNSDTYNIRYASKDDNGIIRINTITANNDNVCFVEDSITKVIIKSHKWEETGNKINIWLFGDVRPTVIHEDISYEFHLPKGSITNDIGIDLK